jgi:uncharacterized protein YndB with AHSA1/START domain
METEVGTGKGRHDAVVTAVLQAPINRVWQALIDPDEIAKYMMGTQVTSDWKEGSVIHWKGEWKGRVFEDTGTVLEVREPELMKYSHRSKADSNDHEHVVTIEVKEVAGVSHLRLTQGNNSTAEEKEQAVDNWTLMLDGLKKMLGEAPVSPPEIS